MIDHGHRSPSLYGAATLQREGDYWTLEFDGRLCRVRHAKGLAFLAELLTQPGAQVSALALQRLVEEGGEVADPPPDAVAWEKGRLNVTRALKLLLKKIVAYHPSAAAHLASALRTGKICSYNPDPKLAIGWKVSTDPAAISLAQSADADRAREANRT